MHHYPRRAGRPFSNSGQQVKGSFIVVIQLDFCGHPLLPDKHTDANSQSLLEFLCRGHFFDGDSWFYCDRHTIPVDTRLIALADSASAANINEWTLTLTNDL